MQKMNQYLSYPIFAIDFDNTLAEEGWPGAGAIKKDAAEVIKWFKHRGVYIIIWTCRERQVDVDAAKIALANAGVPYDRFNENCPELTLKFNADSRKIGADLYIEDKTLLVGNLSWPVIKALAAEAFELVD